MFLLALTALSVLALLPALCAGMATGSQAAIRAAAEVAERLDTGMPAGSTNNHPVSLREVRLANDASSPSATAGVCPAPFGTSKPETSNIALPTHGLLPSASPGLTRGLALGVSRDRAGQPRLPRKRKAFGPDLSSRTASPRPRIECGDADKRRTQPNLSALR